MMVCTLEFFTALYIFREDRVCKWKDAHIKYVHEDLTSTRDITTAIVS